MEEIADDKLETFYLDHYVLTEGKKEKHKKLVFADIECCIDDNRKFTPNLICFERETSDEKYHCWGRMCIRLFLEQLTKWVKEEEKMKDPIQRNYRCTFITLGDLMGYSSSSSCMT